MKIDLQSAKANLWNHPYFFAKLNNLFQTANKVSLFHRITHFFITNLRTFAATMKFVIDDRIPYIREAVARMGVEAVYKEGKSISAADVSDADALIVRTRTRCDASLLEGSRVKFIATATIGYDHLDTEYLAKAGIAWSNCPGCNAASVGQYVRSLLLLLDRDHIVDPRGATMGIVGCGHVGTKVMEVAQSAGMKVLVCDPPKGCPGYVGLERIAAEADIITFHVPLARNEPYATWHMADRGFFDSLAKRPFIVNTSRGEVVDNAALLDAMRSGKVRQAAIDTWENEPEINLGLLDAVYIGTPHIAGYSADGKVNADNMSLKAVCDFFHLPNPGLIVPPSLPEDFVFTGNPLQLYDPTVDSRRLKANPEKFEYLRGHYPLRRETVELG